MEFSNTINFNQFKEKIRNLKETLGSRSDLLNAIKVLEEEKNRFEKLYLEQVKRSTETAKNYYTSTRYKDSFLDLQEKYDNLLQEKKTLEKQFGDKLIVIESQYHLKELDLRDEMNKMTQDYSTQMINTEKHYKQLLTQTNEKVRHLIASNGHLQSEVVMLKTMQSQNNFLQPKVNSSKEIKFYQDRLKDAETIIKKLQDEIKRKPNEQTLRAVGSPAVESEISTNTNQLGMPSFHENSNMKLSALTNIIDDNLINRLARRSNMQSTSEDYDGPSSSYKVSNKINSMNSTATSNTNRKTKQTTINSIFQSTQGLQPSHATSETKITNVSKHDTSKENNNNINEKENRNLGRFQFHNQQILPNCSTSATATARAKNHYVAPHTPTPQLNIMNTSSSANESYETDSYNNHQFSNELNRNQMGFNSDGFRKRNMRYSFTRKLKPGSVKKRKLLNDTLLNQSFNDSDTAENTD